MKDNFIKRQGEEAKEEMFIMNNMKELYDTLKRTRTFLEKIEETHDPVYLKLKTDDDINDLVKEVQKMTPCDYRRKNVY